MINKNLCVLHTKISIFQYTQKVSLCAWNVKIPGNPEYKGV